VDRCTYSDSRPAMLLNPWRCERPLRRPGTGSRGVENGIGDSLRDGVGVGRERCPACAGFDRRIGDLRSSWSRCRRGGRSNRTARAEIRTFLMSPRVIVKSESMNPRCGQSQNLFNHKVLRRKAPIEKSSNQAESLMKKASQPVVAHEVEDFYADVHLRTKGIKDHRGGMP
jgi:hypothetical protein